ncbi:MAG: bifunctional DNA-formamidopyrimidine glycosylase/DNA-(apurinic or apyrimidinic site) lyase [Planctomycetes bacterium]|nr:bifunctional DNA-formamidopyrimidine glycosylase/DNA-(apurinic or apyrimidinic site) lyase [Planctomycetota bacterium]
MPELPEVETMCRGIRSLVGGTVVAVAKPRCACRPISIRPALPRIARRIEGQTIAAIERLGKRVILRFASDDRLVIEPRMTGLVLLAEPPDQDHLRLSLTVECPTKNGRVQPKEMLFWDRRGLGTARLVSPAEFARDYGERLGPDALQITADELQERLHWSRRAIKVALLDQAAVAGIGNLYASEILHLAGIHPAMRCDRLRAANWPPLQAAIRAILTKAIRYEGSTLADGTYRNALNQDGGYQNHHRVYDRADEPCKRCRTAVVRIVQAQRSTFFCPECQPRSAKR